MPNRTVTKQFYSFNASPIIFTLQNPIVSSGVQVDPGAYSATMDYNGSISISLPVPDSGYALYTVQFANNSVRQFALRNGGTVSLDTILSGEENVSPGYSPLSQEVRLEFAANGDKYYVVREACILSNPVVAGVGTLAYAKALAADPVTFNTTTIPVSLAPGDVLRVTCSAITGYKVITFKRA